MKKYPQLNANSILSLQIVSHSTTFTTRIIFLIFEIAEIISISMNPISDKDNVSRMIIEEAQTQACAFPENQMSR